MTSTLPPTGTVTPVTHPAALRRWPLWTAAAITAFTAAVHVVAGTPEMMDPLLASTIDAVPQQTLRVVWHTTSVLLVTFPVVLAWATRAQPAAARPLLAYVWALCAGFAVVFLAVDVAAFGTAVFTLPQWTMFLPPLVLIPLALPYRDRSIRRDHARQAA